MISQTAQELFALKNEIAEIEERQKAELDPKKELLAALQELLMKELGEQGLKSIKTDFANFSMASRKGFTFTDEVKARAWAIENNAYSIDRRLAAQVLKDAAEVPDFIQPVENFYLTIKPTN